MKKFLLVFLFLVVGGAGAFGTIKFRNDYLKTEEERKSLQQQVLQLRQEQSSIGAMTTTWTVSSSITAGKAIRQEDLIEKTEPLANVTEDTIQDTSTIIGKYWKVAVNPGTTITSNLVMEDDGTETIYERDLNFAYLPLGIQVGDYVDVRMVLPYGEELIILSHKRVEQVVIGSKTVKLKMTEDDLARWTSAQRDFALYERSGLSLYITKYTEPGVHTAAEYYYPVRKDVEFMVERNPNIDIKSTCINAALRDVIEIILASVKEEDGDKIYAANVERDNESSTASDIVTNRNDLTAAGEILQDYQSQLDQAGKGILENNDFVDYSNAGGLSGAGSGIE